MQITDSQANMIFRKWNRRSLWDVSPFINLSENSERKWTRDEWLDDLQSRIPIGWETDQDQTAEERVEEANDDDDTNTDDNDEPMIFH